MSFFTKAIKEAGVVLLSAFVAVFAFTFLLYLMKVAAQFNKSVARQSSSVLIEKREKVAIVDTGISNPEYFKNYLCKGGHRDFTGSKEGITDVNGHGTNIAGIIAKYMDPAKECLLIYKFYTPNGGMLNLEHEKSALKQALDDEVSRVNLSLGGGDEDAEEKELLQTLLKRGVVVAVAAGNDKQNLSKKCNYYPACYGFSDKNFHVVQNGYVNTTLAENTTQTNYGGPVTDIEHGTDVEGAGVIMSGTSQATAIVTGKLIQKNRGKHE